MQEIKIKMNVVAMFWKMQDYILNMYQLGLQ